MKTIAILSQKGGAGKTTVAVNLSVIAESKGKTALLLDLDQQGSASHWGDSRSADTPHVDTAQPSRLKSVLAPVAASGAADLVFIDTAPTAQADALEAARAADLVVIPCQPSILDIRAIQHTIDILRLAGKTGVVVLNLVKPQEQGLAEEAREAITGLGIEVLKQTIGARVAFKHAMASGTGVVEYEPKGKAATEMVSLYKTLMKKLEQVSHEQQTEKSIA